MTLWEKALVQHAHPVKLICDAIAFLWGIYLLSEHQLYAGIIALFGIGMLGSLLVARTDKEALAKTPLGKFFLVSAHPANSFFQILGYVILLVAAWQHDTFLILLGVSSILLGHMWGWSQFGKATFNLHLRENDQRSAYL